MSKSVQNKAKSKKRTLESATEETVSKVVEPVVATIAQKKPRKNNKGDQSIIDSKSCVVYLGHIAHGFYETELRAFFQQFGKVRRLKLFRSQKTGGAKGYAFIQFDSNDVAEVVASSLDGYFLAERQLTCHVVPVNKIHDGMFLPPKQKPETVEGQESKAETEQVVTENTVSRRTRRQQAKQEKLVELGIDYTFLSK
jgi:nucleolar protein 15